MVIVSFIELISLFPVSVSRRIGLRDRSQLTNRLPAITELTKPAATRFNRQVKPAFPVKCPKRLRPYESEDKENLPPRDANRPKRLRPVESESREHLRPADSNRPPKPVYSQPNKKLKTHDPPARHDRLSLDERNSGNCRTAVPKRSHSARKSKDCMIPGCTKGARSRGLCKRHGGGKRCTHKFCSRSDQGGGYCIAHGGGAESCYWSYSAFVTLILVGSKGNVAHLLIARTRRNLAAFARVTEVRSFLLGRRQEDSRPMRALLMQEASDALFRVVSKAARKEVCAEVTEADAYSSMNMQTCEVFVTSTLFCIRIAQHSTRICIFFHQMSHEKHILL